ncbi:MAG: hypothetical protein U9Q70_10235 [Chloroflexota bacterium]|nr:hypothetical protein [Chloroflexota bacterium]
MNSERANYFYVHLKLLSNPDFGGYLNIVPLTLAQFIDIFHFGKNLSRFNREILKDLLNRIVGLKNSTGDAKEWKNRIPIVINKWKKHWGETHK